MNGYNASKVGAFHKSWQDGFYKPSRRTGSDTLDGSYLGRDLAAVVVDQERVLGLRHHPVLNLAQHRVAHDHAVPEQVLQQVWCVLVHLLTSALAERQRSELGLDLFEQSHGVRVLQLPVAYDAVDVARLGIVHMARTVGGEGLDRDGHPLPDLGSVAVVIVRYGQARVKDILLDLMAVQVHDWTEAGSLDSALDRSADGVDRRAVVDHLDGDRQRS